jgi:hypothetical protein
VWSVCWWMDRQGIITRKQVILTKRRSRTESEKCDIRVHTHTGKFHKKAQIWL